MSQIVRKLINSKEAAKPVAPYNQAVVADGIVYVSGCLGLCKDTNALVSGGAANEMAQALQNMKVILEAAGSGIDKVVKTMIFVDDLADFARVNQEYKKGTKNFEVSESEEVTMVAKLPANAKVEIDAVAIVGT
ncbi:RutC family protein, partial [Pseudolycoriella hygida]